VHLAPQVRGRGIGVRGHGGQALRQRGGGRAQVLAVAVLREAQQRVAQGADGDDGRRVRLVQVTQREPGAARDRSDAAPPGCRRA
jgi:hypothetical protein